MEHQILINVIIFVAYVLNLPLNTQRSHSRSQRAGKWSLILAHDRRPIYRAPTYIAVPLLGPHQPRYIGLTLYTPITNPYNSQWIYRERWTMRNSINPHQGPFHNHWNKTAGRQDEKLVVFSLKPLINKVVSLMPFPFHGVLACRLVSLQAGIHINFVMGLNRLLETHCIPWWVDLFCQLTRCQDGDMPPCKHKKNFIYRFHDNVYNLYSLWLN